MTTLNDAKLSNTDRISRVTLGFALIGVAYFTSGSLDYLALLPLLAIAPLLTAFLGYCPIEGAVRHAWRQSGETVAYTPAVVHATHKHQSRRQR